MAGTAIEAEALVPSPRDEVFAYLSSLENHWGLADRWIEVVSLEAESGNPGFDRGTVRIHGPLGLRRMARTRVLAAEPPGRIEGVAEIGRTVGRVSWTLSDEGAGGTRVRLAAEVVSATLLDRLLLALGGRRWMAARFRGALARLSLLLSQSR